MDTPIRQLEVSAYKIPPKRPNRTAFARDSTTMVLVEAHAGGKVGLGYTYTDLSAGRLIAGQLTDAVARMDAMAVQAKHLVEEVS